MLEISAYRIKIICPLLARTKGFAIQQFMSSGVRIGDKLCRTTGWAAKVLNGAGSKSW